MSEAIAAVAFDALAAGWDGRHGPWSLRGVGFRLRVALLRRLSRRQQPCRVLDVGCGTGLHLLALASQLQSGLGIDLAPAMVERARRHAHAAGQADRIRFDVLPAAALAGWPGEPFDLVLFLGSLEHIPAPAQALRDTAGCLSRGGLLVTVILHPAHPLGRRASRSSDRGSMPPLRLIAPAEMEAWAAQAGLERVRLAELSVFWAAYGLLAAMLVGRHFIIFQQRTAD
ncbi:MAG TPA: class I SAM-dependent methyltransferase [Geminicoccus sp.]|uniref:class I SAM-dependent methyltransferase n=1 Tax=Geminicoccus sp. TaxID=2024832 RepID=UPI002B62E5B1|nr:class I SAM-dependent methyltransferase [Geminicoccus sp.]HWL72204.1 class I SAM-dependent methyltransferase [Geminicoccus sp.]